MKKVSEQLINYLKSRTDFHMCDLYEITLYDGGTFRYADYDMDITLKDGRIFHCNRMGFDRDKVSLSADEAIDDISIELSIDETDIISGATVIQLARNGGFDDAQLTVYRCFMNSPGVVLDILELFRGEIETPEGGGVSLSINVNSLANRLNNNFPTRCYYPTCPFSLFDKMCGVDINAYSQAGTVTEATKKIIHSNLTFADKYYEQGGIEFTSGVLAGSAHAIRYSNNNTFELLIEAESAPSPGDSFVVFPGCNKTPEECKNKFNNFIHNRATPFVPIKETSVM